MRFMLLMRPNIDQDDASWAPPAEAVAVMERYNDELRKAGALLSLDGLHAPSRGALVSFSGGRATVTDGPFAEAKEVIGGYWMIQVRSKEEAIEWAKRCPVSGAEGATIEVRQVAEMSDFPADVQAALEAPTSG
jgi:hypothetical protein